MDLLPFTGSRCCCTPANPCLSYEARSGTAVTLSQGSTKSFLLKEARTAWKHPPHEEPVCWLLSVSPGCLLLEGLWNWTIFSPPSLTLEQNGSGSNTPQVLETSHLLLYDDHTEDHQVQEDAWFKESLWTVRANISFKKLSFCRRLEIWRAPQLFWSASKVLGFRGTWEESSKQFRESRGKWKLMFISKLRQKDLMESALTSQNLEETKIISELYECHK